MPEYSFGMEEKTMYDISLKYKWKKNLLANTASEERPKALEEKRVIVRELKNDGLSLA